jgi:hypothetical protein
MLTAFEHRCFAEAAALETPEALQTALRQFLDGGCFARLLDGPLRHRADLEEVAARSYRHDNGFWKIVLAETDSYKVRAHVWFPREKARFATSNIHNHRWNFSSILLCGGYEQDLFARCGDEVGSIPVRAWTYHPGHEGAAQKVVEQEGARLKRLSRTRYGKGDDVTLGAEELHRVITNDDVLTASVFVNGRANRSITEVYNERSAAVLPDNLERRLTPAELENTTNELRRVLRECKSLGEHG